MAYKDYGEELQQIVDQLEKLCNTHDLPMIVLVQIDDDRTECQALQSSELFAACNSTGDAENVHPVIVSATCEVFHDAFDDTWADKGDPDLEIN